MRTTRTPSAIDSASSSLSPCPLFARAACLSGFSLVPRGIRARFIGERAAETGVSRGVKEMASERERESERASVSMLSSKCERVFFFFSLRRLSLAFRISGRKDDDKNKSWGYVKARPLLSLFLIFLPYSHFSLSPSFGCTRTLSRVRLTKRTKKGEKRERKKPTNQNQPEIWPTTIHRTSRRPASLSPLLPPPRRLHPRPPRSRSEPIATGAQGAGLKRRPLPYHTEAGEEEAVEVAAVVAAAKIEAKSLLRCPCTFHLRRLFLRLSSRCRSRASRYGPVPCHSSSSPSGRGALAWSRRSGRASGLSGMEEIVRSHA